MARMTQAALGVGCLAGGAPLPAAQWSFAPQVSLAMDSDSNRYLDIENRASQSAAVEAVASEVSIAVAA